VSALGPVGWLGPVASDDCPEEMLPDIPAALLGVDGVWLEALFVDPLPLSLFLAAIINEGCMLVNIKINNAPLNMLFLDIDLILSILTSNLDFI
jgi:hypothetical protein